MAATKTVLTHIQIAAHCLGVPQDARTAFDVVATVRLIEHAPAVRMEAMVGFRTIAVHDSHQLRVASPGMLIEKLPEDVRVIGRLLLDAGSHVILAR